MNNLLISEVAENDLSAIVSLAHRVVEAHVLPGLSPAGQSAIRQSLDENISCLTDKSIYQSLKAVADNRLIGYIAWRNGNHIAQLYVDSDDQGKGLGSFLVNEMLKRTAEPLIKVRSSINAVGFYHRLGFKLTDNESELNGIRFVPMEYTVVPKT